MIYGLYFITEQATPIPFQNVVVEANIVDMIAEVTISQTYKNVEKDTIEAFYKFPIHEAAAVCGFEAEIDEQRKIKGIVKEAKEAAKEYTEAIKQEHGAYLLESEFADVFQCSVGNITPGQTVVIKIKYVTELKHDSEAEEIRFVLPTHIMPRYGSSGSSSSSNDGKILKPDVVSYSNKADYYLNLAITCRMTSDIQNIKSPSHKISNEMNIDRNPKISKITLAEQITYLEKDFILVVKSKDLDQPRAFVEYNPETQTNCVMLTLVPKFALNTTISELVFVVDRSASMSVEPMKKAAQALELLLRSLPEDCYFNVVSFGSTHESLFPKSHLYSESSLSEAINLAQTMTSNYGGTEIFSALEWVFENSRNDMPTSVFLITDGEVWNVDNIVELVRENEEKKKDDLRLFSLGIGDFVSHNLVESVARTGNGYAQFVANNERMDKKVIGMLKNALKPPIKDYKITWTGVDLLGSTEKEELNLCPMEEDKPTISDFDDKTEPSPPPQSVIFTDTRIQQAPYSIPPIYHGVRFIVYCILEKNIKPYKVITLNATSQDGPIRLDIPLDQVTLQGSKIHRLAARKLIQDLDDGKSFIHKYLKNAGKDIPASLIEEHIINLGKTFNLASKYTSFIAIDKKNNEIVHKVQRNIPQRQYGKQTLLCEFDTESFGNKNNLSNLKDDDLSFLDDDDLSFLDEFDCEPSSSKPSKPIASFASLVSFAFFAALRFFASFGFFNSLKSSGSITTSSFSIPPPQEINIKKPKINHINHKQSQIENLFEFLGLQSFDGKFIPSKSFYEFFNKNDLNDFINLKKEIEKELGEIKEIEQILSTCIAIAYLEIIMFEKFKDECEMCYEKAEKVLKNMVKSEEKEKIIVEKSKECITNWVNSNNEE